MFTKTWKHKYGDSVIGLEVAGLAQTEKLHIVIS